MVENVWMSSTSGSWSPADNPYAIAVSEAQWWYRSAVLTALRIHGEDDLRVGFSSHQIDARHLVVELWQLRVAGSFQQEALRELGVERSVVAALGRARGQFDKSVRDIEHIRNGLVHFDDWARGEGAGPQKRDFAAGMERRDVASKYSRFGYDPTADEITFGPYSFQVSASVDAAKDLAYAIFQAAFAVDQRAAVELRGRTVDALAASEVLGSVVQVSPGRDRRIWVSLPNTPGVDRRTLSEEVVAVLSESGLRLLSSMEPQSSNSAERLLGGEALYVESAAQAAGEEVGVRG